MLLKKYANITPTQFDGGPAKGVAGRVVIGKADGADHFCLRVFEIAPDGYTPKHAHPWEHEMFIHAGCGEIFGGGRWNPVEAGTAVFMPPNEEHQVRNTGGDKLVLICLIPAGVAEL